MPAYDDSQSLDLAALRRYYAQGGRVADVIASVYRRITAAATPEAWCSRVDEAAAQRIAAALDRMPTAQRGPLFGVPFAVKDNIDAPGLPTTAGCPAFAYTPSAAAPVVQRLLDAGAVLIGKTNLDQFATGLVGTRSPYGICRNPFNPAYIAGGSSSGSGIAVATGQVSFALATDTAGSGRVPPALCNIIGLKLTHHDDYTRGVVPACRSLDCIGIFALTCDDARRIARAMLDEPRFDNASALGPRFSFAAIAGPDLPDDPHLTAAYHAAVEHLHTLGGQSVATDLTIPAQAGELLYHGPFVAERYAAVGDFIDAHPGQCLDVIRTIITRGREYSAADLVHAQARAAELRHQFSALWSHADVLLLPTIPAIYTLDQVQQDPIRLNSRLGRYTQFCNLLGCAAVAVPAGFTPEGLPAGVTLLGPADSEPRLLTLAARLHAATATRLGATPYLLPEPDPVDPPAGVVLAVVGAHLSGQPLNHQLLELGSTFIRTDHTSPHYRLYALPGGPIPKPGLVRSPHRGQPIELELWSIPTDRVGPFLRHVQHPLAIGSIELSSGDWTHGFVCEPAPLSHATDITHHGGWRAAISQMSSPS